MTELKESGIEFIKNNGERDIYFMDLSKLDLHKVNGKKEGYIAVCPICKHKHAEGIDGYYLDPNYSKRKLGVDKYKTIAHCYRCDSVILGYKDETKVKIPEFHFKCLLQQDAISVTTLMDAAERYSESKDLTDKERALLKMRNPHLDPDLLGMKVAKWNRPNILTPFYLNGNLIYYQIRFLDSEHPKYFSPSIKNKPIFIPTSEYKKDIIICEGVYDAIALLTLYPEYTPVAILGSHITDYQCNLIRKFITPDSISIFMDDTNISEDIYKRLLDTPLASYAEISVWESDGLDPEEILRGGKVINIAEAYESIIQAR